MTALPSSKCISAPIPNREAATLGPSRHDHGNSIRKPQGENNIGKKVEQKADQNAAANDKGAAARRACRRSVKIAAIKIIAMANKGVVMRECR